MCLAVFQSKAVSIFLFSERAFTNHSYNGLSNSKPISAPLRPLRDLATTGVSSQLSLTLEACDHSSWLHIEVPRCSRFVSCFLFLSISSQFYICQRSIDGIVWLNCFSGF